MNGTDEGVGIVMVSFCPAVPYTRTIDSTTYVPSPPTLLIVTATDPKALLGAVIEGAGGAGIDGAKITWSLDGEGEGEAEGEGDEEAGWGAGRGAG